MVLIMATILLGLRAVSQFGYFYQYRSLIELIKVTLRDMVPFLTILFLVVIIMTIASIATESSDETKYHNLASKFVPILGTTYQVIFGENPEAEMEVKKWIVYIFYTLFVNIVCLNLLIAILSNTFDNVQAS